jgi:hypothetical protein
LTADSVTVLRARYQRASRLSLQRQTQDCIEYLQNPQVLVAEFSDSFLMAEAFDHREEDFQAESELSLRRSSALDADVGRMVQAPALEVVGGDAYRFRYVARDIVPLWHRGRCDPRTPPGLDYVGLTRDYAPTPVLGVVDRTAPRAPFVSLLRLFACLAEVATDAQIQRADRFQFKGAVPERMPFDLQVLMIEGPVEPPREPLEQLSHDLAAVFVAQLREESMLPPLIRHILCLRMPASAPDAPFDGVLREDWRVV